LGDYNEKIGRENIFKLTIRSEGSHEINNDIGITVVNCATSKTLVVRSAMFLHYSIREYTWTSPE
jgi:hypothetical protein